MNKLPTLNHSDQYSTVMGAVAKVIAEVASVGKNKENAFKNYMYATLAAVQEALAEPLKEAGLTVIQHFTLAYMMRGEEVTETRVVHIYTYIYHSESNEWLEFLTIMPVEGTVSPQTVGSATTYGRRYALVAFFNLEIEDDDGQLASGGNARPAAKKPAPQRPAPATNAPPKKPAPKKPVALSDDDLRAAVGKASEIIGDSYKEKDFANWASQKVGEPAVDTIEQLSRKALEEAHKSLEARKAANK